MDRSVSTSLTQQDKEEIITIVSPFKRHLIQTLANRPKIVMAIIFPSHFAEKDPGELMEFVANLLEN